MKIVFVGAGRLATNLGYALTNAGHDVIQVFSRTIESASEMAKIVGGSPTDRLNELSESADVYIIALKDSVIADILPKLCQKRQDSVFLHTSGSVPLDIFTGMATHYGVLYPLQTFSKERRVDFSEIPFFLEASDEYTLDVANELATSVSDRVIELSSDDRKQIHLAAVFANNFTNHCYTIASDILSRKGLPFDIMLPLIDETARKVHSIHPAEAQTGPAVRYDENIIRAHGDMLRFNPFIKDIYDRMSIDINRRKNLEF